MTTLQRTLDYLDRKRVPYIHTTHPHAHTAREVAIVEHIPPDKLAKTVVFHSALGYGMAVVRADEFVDFEELRTLLGVPLVRLVTEEELAELFPGGELGAMPPLGSLFGLAVFVDAGLLAPNKIGFNAGTHRDLIRMSVDDFLRLTEPVVGDFAMRVQSAARL
jgi:Ala-tRNA(Pro) deacylase